MIFIVRILDGAVLKVHLELEVIFRRHLHSPALKRVVTAFMNRLLSLSGPSMSINRQTNGRPFCLHIEVLFLRQIELGKLSTNGPPETSQSACNHLFYDFQLRLHFVNCVPIFWIERPIASPESAAIPTQSIQSKDNSVQCRIATT